MEADFDIPSSTFSEETAERPGIYLTNQTPPTVSELRTYAQNYQGFIDDSLRRKAWPILLRCSPVMPGDATLDKSWRELPHHKDEAQVELDVNRAFVYYPKDQNETQLRTRKQELSDLIVRVLRSYPQLNYFQGYHDVAQVLLLVLGTELAPQALTHLSFLHVRDFMLSSLTPSISQLNLVPSILEAVHPRLFRHLSATQPVFALSATLTMYAHHVQEFGEIVRLFDFLLAQPAVVSLYFFATIISSRSKELLAIPSDDPAVLHSMLSRLPKDMDFEQLITQTVDNFAKHPPEAFPSAWWRISSHSVLKTTRWGLGDWTVRMGEEAFAAHMRQIEREETRDRILAAIWKYRVYGVKIGFAVSVAFVSYWLAGQVGREWLSLNWRPVTRLLG